MSHPLRRGESGSLVSSWNPSSSAYTPQRQTSQWNPYGLQVRNLIYGTHLSIAGDGTTATATTKRSMPHGLFTGQTVTIYGPHGGTYTVTVTSPTTFTYSNSVTGTFDNQCIPSLFPAIPSNITFVWAICVGAGGKGYGNSVASGGGGGINAGWTLATNSNYKVARGCDSSYPSSSPFIQNKFADYTYYNTIFAPGASMSSTAQSGGLQQGYQGQSGAAGRDGVNCSGYGPQGQMIAFVSSSVLPTNGTDGYYGGTGLGSQTSGVAGGGGGNGVSGGPGGGFYGSTGSGIGGNGGSGFIGGGGGCGRANTGPTSWRGGNGGSGRNLIDPTITYTGGAGNTLNSTSGLFMGGGGAGCLENGEDAGSTSNTGGAGGTGGGGACGGNASVRSGAGAIYILY